MSNIDFTSLPNKKYYSISEVSNLLGIKQTEIRYWEKFEPKLKSKSKSRSYSLKKIKLIIRFSNTTSTDILKGVTVSFLEKNRFAIILTIANAGTP